MSKSIAAASLDAPWEMTLGNTVISFSPLPTATAIAPQSTASTHPEPSVITVERSGQQSTVMSEQQVPISNPPDFYESWLIYYLEIFPGQRRKLEDLLGKEDKVFVEEFERILQEVKDKLDESGSDVAKSIRQWYITGLTEIIQELKDRESNGPPNDPQQTALSAFENRTKATNDEITKQLSPPEAEPSPSRAPINEAAVGAMGLAGIAFALLEMHLGNM
jgi:hypothetical protein